MPVHRRECINQSHHNKIWQSNFRQRKQLKKGEFNTP